MESPLADGSRFGLGHLPAPVRLAMFALVVGCGFQAAALTNGVHVASRCTRTGLSATTSGSAQRMVRGNLKRSGFAPDAVIEPDTASTVAASSDSDGMAPQAVIAAPDFAVRTRLANVGAVSHLADARPRFVSTTAAFGRPPPTA